MGVMNGDIIMSDRDPHPKITRFMFFRTIGAVSKGGDFLGSSSLSCGLDNIPTEPAKLVKTLKPEHYH